MEISIQETLNDDVLKESESPKLFRVVVKINNFYRKLNDVI